MVPGRYVVIVLLAAAFVLEGFDINAMALAVPRLVDELQLAPDAFGWVFTGLLVGLGVGGALLAPLGDRIGRRPLIVLGCLGVAGATLGTATADGITEFLVWRFVTGLALGAVLPNCTALAAELAPPRLRATLIAVVSAGIPLGLALAGLAAPSIVAMSGWRGLFVFPGVAAVLLAAALWLAVEGRAPVSASADDAASAPRPAAGRPPQFELMAAPWAFPFMVFSVLLAINAFNLSLLNSWLPTVLPQAGLTLDDAARMVGVVQLAGLVIGIGACLLVDRWRPGAALLLLFAAMAVSFGLVRAIVPDPLHWMLLLCVGVGGASAGAMAVPSLCAYLFPPGLLSSAVGMGLLVARLGAFVGPPLGGAMLAAHVDPRDFLGVAAIPAAVCALACLLVPAALAVRTRVERAGQAAV